MEFTADQASAALTAAGVDHDPARLDVEARDDRFTVRLDPWRMAWFPANAQGRALLAKERRVLRLLERYCSFSAPRVLHESETGWDLRALVPGMVDAKAIYGRLVADPDFAQAHGRALGAILAEQHGRIPAAELQGWLPSFPAWPRPEDLPHLPEVVDDKVLIGRMMAALERREALRKDLADPVLVQCDLGPHNMAVDPETFALNGLFDYEGAAFGDRHEDFTYMIFDLEGEAMLDGAIAAYEPATGVRIDRDRVRLFNAVAAIGFMAYRHGHAPEEDWCGRTLAQDLSWTRWALERVGL